MIAVLLEDEQGLAGQRFGFTYWNQDIASRNAALAKARRWMATSSALR